MASLDDFLAIVRGRLPGCPDFILKEAVRDAAIEFCKRTRLLVERITVAVEADEAAVTLSPATDLHWEVLDLRRDNTRLTPWNRREATVQDQSLETGTPQYYYQEGDLTLVLSPIPDADETLTALVTLRPDDAATTLPDVLWTDYREPVAAGARAWVRRNHGDWVNPELEAEDRAIFERAIHNQNIRRARGGADTALRVRAHPF
jgi:hypothetical protein